MFFLLPLQYFFRICVVIFDQFRFEKSSHYARNGKSCPPYLHGVFLRGTSSSEKKGRSKFPPPRIMGGGNKLFFLRGENNKQFCPREKKHVFHPKTKCIIRALCCHLTNGIQWCQQTDVMLAKIPLLKKNMCLKPLVVVCFLNTGNACRPVD